MRMNLRHTAFAGACGCVCCACVEAASAQSSSLYGEPSRRVLTLQDAFTYVPTPEPPTIGLNDIVTVVVKDAFQYTNEGELVQRKLANLEATLEDWIIRTLAFFDIVGERRADRIGVWVRRPDKGSGCEDKIAAIGIRVKQWVTLHGMALNIAPDLSHFSGIVPCGVSEKRYGVTSLADLGIQASMADVDKVLRREFDALFGQPAGQMVDSTENISPPARTLSSASVPSR